jgi:regulatory protein
MRVAPKPASLKVRALQWLAQREHSRIELRVKLLRLLKRQADTAEAEAEAEADCDSASAEVDALLDWLGSHGYLSQERFVESRVHARQSRFGNQRITRELQQHGVALDPTALQALRDSEYERARAVWQRKYGAPAAPADAAARVRQTRLLARRHPARPAPRRDGRLTHAPGGQRSACRQL